MPPETQPSQQDNVGTVSGPPLRATSQAELTAFQVVRSIRQSLLATPQQLQEALNVIVQRTFMIPR